MNEIRKESSMAYFFFISYCDCGVCTHNRTHNSTRLLLSFLLIYKIAPKELEATTCGTRLPLRDSKCTEILRQRGEHLWIKQKYMFTYSMKYWKFKTFVTFFSRDKNGKIVKAAPFQSRLSSGSMARVEPNRKWFGKIRPTMSKL